MQVLKPWAELPTGRGPSDSSPNLTSSVTLPSLGLCLATLRVGEIG